MTTWLPAALAALVLLAMMQPEPMVMGAVPMGVRG